MTYKEELLRRHPDSIRMDCFGGVLGCPGEYFLGAPESGNCGKIIAEENCEKCWNTEIPIPTNADRIRAMSNAKLREFLEDVANSGGETMWSKQFSEKFCDSCPTVTGKIEGCNKEMEFNECEFADGKCPHGNELDWWLRQPAKEET